MELKKVLSRTYKWEYFWLCLIVVATLGCHFIIVNQVHDLILDEQHYVNDARIIIANHETMRSEHPPLGKLFIVAGEYIFSGFKSPEENSGTTTQQAITDSSSTVIDVSDASVFSFGKAIIIDSELMIIESINTSLNQITVQRGVGGTASTSHIAQQTIYVFNDNPMGWRFFPIVFGTASIVMFYFVCRRLDMSRETSSIATFLLGFENLTFLQASVAMLDVFFLTFMIGVFLLYLNRKYISSGITLGLGALAKLDGALAAPVIFFHWLFSRQRRSWRFFLTAFFAIIGFVELMIPLDYLISRSFHNLADPLHRIQTMLQLTGSLTFANVQHPSLSRPWEWLITYKPMAYYIMPHYTAAISFTIFVLAIPSFGYLVYKAVKRSEAGLFGLAWYAGTFIVMCILSVITNRVSYPYYFYPVVGAICIGVALFLADLLAYFRRKQYGKLKWTALSIVIFILVAHLLSFLILSPLIHVDFAKLVGITG